MVSAYNLNKRLSEEAFPLFRMNWTFGIKLNILLIDGNNGIIVPLSFIGAWRSLVAHWHGVSGVGGSNPLAPTILI